MVDSPFYSRYTEDRTYFQSIQQVMEGKVCPDPQSYQRKSTGFDIEQNTQSNSGYATNIKA